MKKNTLSTLSILSMVFALSPFSNTARADNLVLNDSMSTVHVAPSPAPSTSGSAMLRRSKVRLYQAPAGDKEIDVQALRRPEQTPPFAPVPKYQGALAPDAPSYSGLQLNFETGKTPPPAPLPSSKTKNLSKMRKAR